MSILNRDTALLPSDVFVVSDKLPPELYEKYRYYRTLSLAMADATAGIHVLCYNTPTSYTSVTGVTVSFIKPGLSEMRLIVGLHQATVDGTITQSTIIKNELGLLPRTTPSITQADPVLEPELYTYNLGSAAVARLSGWVAVPTIFGGVSASGGGYTHRAESFSVSPITTSSLLFRTQELTGGIVTGFGSEFYTVSAGGMMMVEFRFIKVDGFTFL